MRLTLPARCSGVTAMRAMMVEQLGLATIPPCPGFMPAIASGLTSGMTKGTPSSMRKALLLSTTCGRSGRERLMRTHAPQKASKNVPHTPRSHTHNTVM